MNNRKLLALLVVLVLSIAFSTPPAISATRAFWRGATSTPGEVNAWNWKGDGDTSGDDDRWGDPNDNDPQDEVPADEDTPEEPPEEPPEKPVVPGRVLCVFLFGNWFVL